MPATEPIQGGPYPEPSDAPDGPNQMAEIVAWSAGRLVMRFVTATARDAAITSPVEGMIAQTGSGATLTEWTYRSGTWQNTTVPGTWTPYTPAILNLTLGNGTLSARYAKIGRTVHSWGSIVLGSTSAITGTVIIDLPAPALASLVGPLGVVLLTDASTGTFLTQQAITLGGAVNFVIPASSAGYINGAAPWTWATGDKIQWSITYEAA